MSEPPSLSLSPLYKHRSWSPDVCREEIWDRRKNRRRRKSVTEDDLDELKACIELGFGFDERLSDTLPALQLLYASKSTPPDNPRIFLLPGGNEETTKARLRQWAQVVACSVQQRSFP